MKKKILISIIIIVIAILILFGINYLRNYFILKDIYNKNAGYLDSLNNFYYKKIINSDDIQETEIYYKDGIYLDNSYKNNQKKSFIWKNINTDEFFGGEYLEDGTFKEFSKEEFNEYNPKYTDNYAKVLFDETENLNNVIKANIFRFIPTDENCYIINTQGFQKKVDKETGTVKAISVISENETTMETSIILEINTVTEQDVIKPSI